MHGTCDCKTTIQLLSNHDDTIYLYSLPLFVHMRKWNSRYYESCGTRIKVNYHYSCSPLAVHNEIAQSLQFYVHTLFCSV